MYDLAYHRPRTLDDALRILRNDEDCKILGGGQSLIPALKQRLAAPSGLVSTSHLSEMHGVQVHPDVVCIGAATVYAEVAFSQDIQRALPVLAELAGVVADAQVRNRGTVGGSLANNDPSADFPAAALALCATVETTSRVLEYEDFLAGLFTTALNADEIVTQISFRRPTRGAYEKIRHPASRYAMAGVLAAEFDGRWRIAVTGAGDDGVFRLPDLEDQLSCSSAAPAMEDIVVGAPMMVDGDVDEDYRKQIVRVAAHRAIKRAMAF